MGGFKVNGKDFLSALKAPAAVCDVRAGLPIFACVVVTAEGGVAEIKASDGDVDVTAFCSAEAENGRVSMALPGKQLSTIFKDLPAEVGELEVDENSKGTVIRAGRSRYRVNGLDPAVFPMRKNVGEGFTTVEMEAGALKSALKAVGYAAVRGADRPLLAAVCVETDGGSVQFVATDSRRLAVATREAKVSAGGVKSAVVPTKAVALLEGLLGDEEKVLMRFDSRTAVFEIGEPATAGSAQVATKLVEGKYPNWRQVVPKGAMESAKVGREDLLLATRRVSAALMTEGGSTVTLAVSAGTLEVSGQGDHGEASGSIEATWSGKDPAKAAYNAAYLMEPLKASVLDEVTLNMDGAAPDMKPLLLTSEGEGLRYVLMPVRPT